MGGLTERLSATTRSVKYKICIQRILISFQCRWLEAVQRADEDEKKEAMQKKKGETPMTGDGESLCDLCGTEPCSRTNSAAR